MRTWRWYIFSSTVPADGRVSEEGNRLSGREAGGGTTSREQGTVAGRQPRPCCHAPHPRTPVGSRRYMSSHPRPTRQQQAVFHARCRRACGPPAAHRPLCQGCGRGGGGGAGGNTGGDKLKCRARGAQPLQCHSGNSMRSTTALEWRPQKAVPGCFPPTRVPVAVQQHQAVGPRQVQPRATGGGGEQEYLGSGGRGGGERLQSELGGER